jgi:hypothetical protein
MPDPRSLGRTLPSTARAAVSRLARGLPFALCGLAAVVAGWPLADPALVAQTRARTPSVSPGADGKLAYVADDLGNTIIDFSHAGYGGGGEAIPDVPVRVVVGPGGRRDGDRIQAALDLAADLPPDARGLRGAVLLEAGRYDIEDSLRLTASGVVLRGAGQGEGGTVLVAVGTSRRPLIVVSGEGTWQALDGTRHPITTSYVPVGARTLEVEDASAYRAGDTVLVERRSTSPWISLLAMDVFEGWRPENRLHWQPGSRDIVWDRVVVRVEGRRMTLDAPLTTAIDTAFGGGTVTKYEFPGRIRHVGVEHVLAVSDHDDTRPGDEDHAWTGVSLDRVEHAWVRQVVARHFVGSAVDVGPQAKWVTVEDVEALDPVSEVGGFRRRVFAVSGQLTLVQRSHSRGGQHDFVTGHAAAGPNVFLDAAAIGSLGFSGPLGSWGSGVLYDNVRIRGEALRLGNRDVDDQGAGWAAANSVLWNCEASDIEVHSPPGAHNRAFGCKGAASGDGIVEDDFYRALPVEPRSLYLAQLVERRGADAVTRLARRKIPSVGSGARRLTASDLTAWDERRRREAMAHASQLCTPVAAEGVALPQGPTAVDCRLEARDGRFWMGAARAWTTRTSYSWFQAQMVPALAAKTGPAITRFAPGMTGRGLTDDLEEVVAAMPIGGVFYQHYGLWYDRRRVNHNYDGSASRRTGDVWAPFMELPWSRSGEGTAWDGLSLFDLTRFNPWYFERVRRFAELADRDGRVLYYNFYFQHWLLESRSHYVDFPWRPVNALQQTGMPDEVPAANAFHDVTHSVRRDLHRLYLRKVLETLGHHRNVVFGIDREYTGSLAFVRFWLDTIAEWQREHGRTVLIALEIPRDQMDAVLEDPTYRPLITAIDFHGWIYRADGRLFAIRGDLNRAPREQRPGIASPEELATLRASLGSVATDERDFLNAPEYQKLFDALWAGSRPMKYRAWREYRDRYPDLVILTEQDEYPQLTAAIEAEIPRDVRAKTRPVDLIRRPRDAAWVMAAPGETYVVYTMNGGPVALDLSDERKAFTVAWVDASGRQVPAAGRLRGGSVVQLEPPAMEDGRPWVAWLQREAAAARPTANRERR